MKKIESECKGCVSYKRDHCRLGVIPYISNEIQCPCRSCLVKVVCSDTVCCDVFRTYRILSNETRDMDIIHINQWRNK